MGKGIRQKKQRLTRIYQRLFDHYGPCNWWPGNSTWEIIVGAILTQNTAWANVEKAITNLKAARVLSLVGMHRLSDRQLAGLIRPSGYYNQKTKKLRAFLEFLDDRYRGSLVALRRRPLAALRPELLRVWGLGPETVDSILLYALDKPVFVVDAYTRRICSRHGLIGENWHYDRIQNLFVQNIPIDTVLYNEYHALIVNCGKDYCRPRPHCAKCPLRPLLSCLPAAPA